MDRQNHKLHVFIFPFPGQGHIIPLVDMAKLFAMRGVKTTIIDTDFMSVPISSKINNLDIVTIKFPFVEAGLPEGCNLTYLQSRPDLRWAFMTGTGLLQQPLEQVLEEYRPDCLVSDMFFPWTTEAAGKFGIPRIVFHGTGFFSLCASESIRLYEPHKKVSSDTEPFLIPHFPTEIELTRKKLPDSVRQESDLTKFFKKIKESELRSYGVIVNSFYELESAYADHYRNVLGRKAWHVGPVSVRNTEIDEKLERGKKADIDKHQCLKWLDSKKPNSVVYICFGTNSNFTDSQLLELATGLEAAGQQFIWVVSKEKSGEHRKEEWLPEGFEARMEGKGMIIRGWAPQVLILDHEAVGGFVTHCGWNSLLEGVCAGVTMVTWPVGAEQFYNEKLVTQVLGTGVGVGVKEWIRRVGDFVKREAITNAVREIMVGDKAEEMRSRALALKQAAHKAVENCGSSYLDMTAFIEELSSKN